MRIHILSSGSGLLAIVFALTACSAPPQKGAWIHGYTPVPDAVGYVVELDQGWTDGTQQSFYNTPQGSEIMPYAWIVALEQAHNNSRFLDPANIERFRYLPRTPTADNPDGLPIGWTRGRDSAGTDWFGLNCSACHTTQFTYTLPTTGQTLGIRVDGAPTLADFNQMNLDLVASLQATMSGADKFDRFAKAVLGSGDSPDARLALRGEMSAITAALDTRNRINKADVDYGFGRIDAIGFIFNQTLATLPGMPQNAKPSDAPASYPFLWGTDQSDVVQWTGFAANSPRGAGALVRNGGEVIGVYGRVQLTEHKTYASGLLVENLGKIENWVRELRSPMWPDAILPKIDRDKAALGEPLFQELCASCHQVIPRADEGRAYTAVITPIGEIGTDPTELDNMLQREYDAGVYKGKKSAVVAGSEIPDPTTGLNPLINAVVGSLLHHPGQSIEALLDEHATKTTSAQSNANGYKARPLNGIWATAPYLHNGSVPNLYELLLPAAQRSKTFVLGSRQFDPVRVGYATNQPTTAKGYAPFTLDTRIKGNLNTGHEFVTHKDGTPLTDAERWQLVEYMKTL